MTEDIVLWRDYRAWKHWETEDFAKCDRLSARYYEAEFSKAGVDFAGPPAMLEIGFGNGALAAWARERGWRYSGTELDPELVRLARAAEIDAYEAGTPIAKIAPEVEFDLVVALDVLEHLSVAEIGDLLSSIRGRLAANGLIVARFPSGDSPFSGAIQHGDITHKTVLGTGMVEQLALETGYRAVQIRAPIFPLTGIGLRRMLRRLPIAAGRSAANRLLRLLYFDNSPKVIDSNMVVVLRPESRRASKTTAF